MKIKTEADVEQLVRSDPWMMDALAAAETLDLPDWWIGGGFLRNKIWDAIEGIDDGERTDIDLVYFDPSDTTVAKEEYHDRILTGMFPDGKWETWNQARMHTFHHDEPYRTTAEAAARWTERATGVAVRKRGKMLEFLWCHGMDDILNMVARPIAHDKEKEPHLLETFHERVAKKRWQERWPHLVIKED